MTADVLDARALNRATLERQLLLRRSARPVIDVVDHLVGLQAQQPRDPYVALWSRLDRFDPLVLSGMLADRAVVRVVVMRGTIHLISAADGLMLRPLVQSMLDRELDRHSEYGASLRGADLTPVVDHVRTLLDGTPMTGAEMRAAIEAQFPDVHAAAFAYACRNRLVLVQVPPRGLWKRGGQVRSATVEAWLGRPVQPSPSIDDLVLRYFGAFGPATPGDVGAWSGLPAMREVVERLRPRLRTFRDERGRELFDLPDAPRPPGDTPAPVRFLPEYDNLLLSHADRTRFIREDTRPLIFGAARAVHGAVLHDGMLVGTWRCEPDVLTVDHASRLTAKATAAIAAEGRRLLRFLHRPDPPPSVDVRFSALA